MDKVYHEATKKAGWGPSKAERTAHAKALEKAKGGKEPNAKALRAKEAIYGTGTNKKVEGMGHLRKM